MAGRIPESGAGPSPEKSALSDPHILPKTQIYIPREKEAEACEWVANCGRARKVLERIREHYLKLLRKRQAKILGWLLTYAEKVCCPGHRFGQVRHARCWPQIPTGVVVRSVLVLFLARLGGLNAM